MFTDIQWRTCIFNVITLETKGRKVVDKKDAFLSKHLLKMQLL